MANTLDNNIQATNGQTCLERFGVDMRKKHLIRNEWKKDLPYTKAYIDAEYDVQTEFVIYPLGDNSNENTYIHNVDDTRKIKNNVETETKRLEFGIKPKETLKN